VPAEARARDLSAGIFQPSPDDLLVTLELEPAGRWVADYYPCESVEEIGRDRLLVTLRVADPRWIRRLCLRLGGTGRILDPPDLSEEVFADAAAALAAYAEDVRTVPAG
jgi:proteasome accessory factor C